jgi:TolB-like protein/class 3 adenylate cyclase/Tfp pilus assembly protein PilF
MATQEVKRKLTAILSADVKGYSRLMGEDEKWTVRTLNAYKEVMAGLIQNHHGRVVDAPGDNVLAEFVSVVDAVECAIEVQKELKAKNTELPENQRMEFRIGVNIGDVIEEGKKIYGDGINIAARVESLAEGGGICISGTVYDHVKNKLDLEYEFLGEKEVKNIAEPVRVYRVQLKPGVELPLSRGERRIGLRRWHWAAMAVVVLLVAGFVTLAIWKYYTPFVPSREVASKEKVTAIPSEKPEAQPLTSSPKAVPPWEKETFPSPAKPSTTPTPTEPAMEVASVKKMAYPLPDKPSIAVLPFVNMSGDPQQEYFSDGLTEDIITALSKVQRLFVIARNSTFTYKKKPVKVQQVAEELGVRYVLEGSVQRAGDRVRITAQLIDALKGHHLWAERYDRDLKDLFALQNEITMKILMALHVKLLEGEQALVRARGTNNFEAYEKFLQATEQHYLFTREAGVRARQLCEEAIALDSGYAAAYGLLSVVLLAEVRYRWTRSPSETMRQALEMAEKALTLDPKTLVAQLAMGQIHMLKRDYDEAIAWGERAVSTYPNADNAHVFLAWFLTAAGRPEEAVPLLKQAIRRNPIPPGWYFMVLGNTFRMIGRFDEAISELKKAVAYSPDELLAHVTLAAAYAEAGRLEEARVEAAEVIRIQPTFSLENYAKGMSYKNQAHSDRFIEALRKAGLK